MSASALATTIELPNKQTGPRTGEGKARSSTNAITHGGASRKLIIPGESQQQFDALLAALRDEYNPGTIQSQIFVDNLAAAHWFLLRRQRAYSAIEAAVYELEPDAARWTEEHLKRLSLADRYRTQAERALQRALANIEAWRKSIRSEAQRDRKAAEWAAAQALRERRLALAEEKLKLATARAADRAFRFANLAHTPRSSGSTAAETPNSSLNSSCSFQEGAAAQHLEAA